MSTLCSCGHRDLVTGYPEFFCQELEQVLIGFAVDGRGGDAYLQAGTIETDDFIPTGARLHIDSKYKSVLLPGEKRVTHPLNANWCP